MLDRRREDLARLFKVSTGIEHVVDLGAVPGPLLDLVEVAVVSDERVVVSSAARSFMARFAVLIVVRRVISQNPRGRNGSSESCFAAGRQCDGELQNAKASATTKRTPNPMKAIATGS